MGSLDVAIPFWHVNVPEAERTPECPKFLFGLNAKDLRVVSTPDPYYHVQNWEEVCTIIQTNTLELFQRVPSELRRYKAFTYKLAQIHGTIANFVLKQRLGWTTPVFPRGSPFQYRDDIKILYNDWPYGLDPRIVHLVIWTKFELKSDPVTGDLTHQARQEIDDFMTTTFRSRVPADKVRKNVFLSNLLPDS